MQNLFNYAGLELICVTYSFTDKFAQILTNTVITKKSCKVQDVYRRAGVQEIFPTFRESVSGFLSMG